jgi:hypothetical protein
LKRLFGILFLCACLHAPALAQDKPSPQALKVAQELTDLINGDTVKEMSGALVGQMWPSVAAQLAGKVDNATLDELRAEVERSASTLSIDMMKNAPAVYARNFSLQELRDILAFYKTPTGAKALHVIPKVMAEIGTALAPRMPEFQKGLSARLAAIMQKHGYKN